MKSYQKGYLELNRIWMSRQEYENHQKRLQSIKHPRIKMNIHQTYNNQKEQTQYYKIKHEQLVNNRKKEIYRWQDIQEQNNLFLRRLVKINQRNSSSLTPPLSQSGTPRGANKRVQYEVKHRIEVENKRLKEKVQNIEACIKSKSFSVSFERHQRVKENMQKFLQDSSDKKIRLRADQFIDNLQNKKLMINRKLMDKSNAQTLYINASKIKSIQNTTNYSSITPKANNKFKAQTSFETTKAESIYPKDQSDTQKQRRFHSQISSPEGQREKRAIVDGRSRQHVRYHTIGNE